MSDSTVRGRSAFEGGALFILGHGNISNSTLTENSARLGGAIAAVKFVHRVALKLFGTNLTHNVAAQGSAIFSGIDHLEIHGGSIVSNNATATQLKRRDDRSGNSGALYNTGSAVLFGALIQNNHAPARTGMNVYNGGNITYVLPAPLGFFMPSVFQCQEILCASVSGINQVACKTQTCDFLLLNDQHVANVVQGPTDAPIPSICQASYFANSTLPQHQSSSFCAGEWCAADPRPCSRACATPVAICEGTAVLPTWPCSQSCGLLLPAHAYCHSNTGAEWIVLSCKVERANRMPVEHILKWGPRKGFESFCVPSVPAQFDYAA